MREITLSPGQSRLYKVSVASGETLRVSLTPKDLNRAWPLFLHLWLTAPSFADTTDLIAGSQRSTLATGQDLGFRQNAPQNLQFTLSSDLNRA